MSFGKLINGKLCNAPHVLNKDGKQYINPTDDLYLEYGYWPLEYSPIPDIIDGYHLVQSWYQSGDKLIQKWNYEPNEETLFADSYLMERIQKIEERLNLLTFSLNKISESVIEVVKKEDSEFANGDYLNPIHYVEGMLVEVGLFYTDEENIWEAIKNGIPSGFNDTEYFDII